MPYQIDTATDYLDLLDRVRRYCQGYGVAGTPAFTGTGNGTIGAIDTHPATVTETWTITVTDATTPGAEVWSVTGSVSGVQASATTGVAYDNGLLAFTITAGVTNFAVNDQFTIATTQGDLSAAGTPWIEDEWDGSTQLIMHAPGLTGTEAIYVGLRAFESVADDYFNWELRGYTGYTQGLAFGGQPGASQDTYLHLWNSSIPYWLIVNGQRLILIAKISTVYEAAYLGKINPFATPSQYPYPLLVAGMSTFDTKRWSDTSEDHRSFQDPARYGGCQIYKNDGTWQEIANAWDSNGEIRIWDANMLPVAAHKLRDNIDGTLTLFPLTPSQKNPEPNTFGELDGAYLVPGFSVGSEDAITIGADTYVIFQNAYRTGIQYYKAIKLA